MSELSIFDAYRGLISIFDANRGLRLFRFLSMNGCIEFDAPSFTAVRS
jgi:hypothetical protein